MESYQLIQINFSSRLRVKPLLLHSRFHLSVESFAHLCLGEPPLQGRFFLRRQGVDVDALSYCQIACVIDESLEILLETAALLVELDHCTVRSVEYGAFYGGELVQE